MKDVAAVVVTRNRSSLLRACLQASRDQELPPSAWFVINNASQDNTLEVLSEDGWLADPRFHLTTLASNLGGAGGFLRGMSEAFNAGHEWLWIMDDDCIGVPSTLSSLAHAHASFPRDQAPTLLCSRVEWTDGTLHALNLVAIKDADKDRLYTAPLYNTMSIRSCTFVSVLVHRTMIASYGYPNAVYFIWMDDVEWTARVLRREFGVLVPSSRVTHATEGNHGTLDARPERFFYYIRNCLWTLLGSTCFSRTEKTFRGLTMLYVTARWMRKRSWSFAAWSAVFRGFVRGLMPPLRSFDPGSRARFQKIAVLPYDGIGNK